jgi:aspartyl-tRNA(Asn)/glutamyl-tRNA(Gln) amidotransferase subunit A
MLHDVAFLSAGQLLRLFASKALSPVEATHAALDQISRHNAAVNAYCLIDEERALRAAAESEARWMRSAPLGLVDGIPTSVKDIILTRGWPTLRGSRTISPDQVWDENAPCVDRLLENGAVLLGKTTTPEFGWKGVTDSPLTGVTRNPWDLSKTPGGSSGGAAVAAALGMGALHIGTDGGGSIRIPASFTGICGIKPTFGRVPAFPPSPFADVAHIGPLTRTVEDAALMLQVMAAPDRRDWQSLPPPPDYREGLAAGVNGLRIGYSPDLGFATVDAEVADSVAKVADLLAAMGATIVDATIDLQGVHGVFRALWCAGASVVVSRIDPVKREAVDPGLRKAAEFGASQPLNDYLSRMSDRSFACHTLSMAFERFDVLLTPATPITAFAAGRETPEGDDWDWTSWTPFTYPFNLSHQPAIVMPCGLSEAGLPIAAQLVAPRFADGLLLRCAATLEAALPAKAPSMAEFSK